MAFNFDFDFNDPLGLNTVKVLAGEIPAGNYLYDHGVLTQKKGDKVLNLRSPEKAPIEVNKETAETAKHWVIASGAAGILFLIGPWFALLGFFMAGNKEKVTVSMKLEDDTEFLCIMDASIYRDILTLVVEHKVTMKLKMKLKAVPPTVST